MPDGLLATILDLDVMLPCVGQGAIGIEIRAEDERIANDQLLSSEGYRNLIVAYRSGAPIRITDDATDIDGAENTKQAAWSAVRGEDGNVGQDPTRYGVDRGEGFQMAALLRRLARIEELRWIRLMYLFPDRHAEPVLESHHQREQAHRVELQIADQVVARAGVAREPQLLAQHAADLAQDFIHAG